ncbi:hypothetical protein BDFB_001784 [Asbolus verrucosus]|uniref:Uncharacterized protein n=1 Tax=Asbolus verrucosus TaxID=1661398 RepID=A0A482VUH7_ASBVE|nr:hypothetical protein BDFB_001784 [Asbolus verrucosus]
MEMSSPIISQKRGNMGY